MGVKRMETENHRRDTIPNAGRQTVMLFMMLVFLVVVGVSIFLKFYNNYNDEILYAERLNQMQEVTEQLFAGLEDVVEVQWVNARYQCNYLRENLPTTVTELLEVMKQQSFMAEMDRKQSKLIAVDSQGRYYYPDGKQGLMVDMSYLDGRPEQISCVLNPMTGSKPEMLFLYQMDEPIILQDNEQTVQLIYYGIAEDMEQLNPYFECKAYNSSNSTYVTDTKGLKLFTGNKDKDLLKGFNVFSELRNMQYLHDLTFDDTLETMQKTGLAYSNVILDGDEYYYALYQMENAEWTLLFLVPSGCVAVNTVQMVNTTTMMFMIFAAFMSIVCAVMIYIVLRIQQQKALRVANDANAVLEANNRKLEQAQAKTAEALQVAEAASKAKTEFLSNMSHDIRTPMNAIVGITRLMAHDKNDPAKIDTYIEKVQQSSQHLLSLINDVLDMSKIESDGVVLNKEPIGLSEQIWQIESIMRPQIEERRQRFVVSTHNITHEHLIGDTVRLRQIFINLLSNAIKYTPCGGSIRLDLEELTCDIADHTKLRISVTDSGCGMSPEFVEHIFEPFTRAENSTTNRVQGTGLGMAITKNIVDLAEGTISVQSEVNKGSCFIVELPFLIDHDAKVELSIHSMLLIADENILIDNVKAATRETNIELRVAKSEEEADNLLQQNTADVVLLGSHLYGDALADDVDRIRKEAGKTLVFFCCNYEDQEQFMDIRENNGIDGVLVRPFFLSDLALAVDHICNEELTDESESISALNGRRFLCAEDNELNAEILEALLDMNGASCVIYPDGQKIVEAFASVNPGDFDAILMDVQMPEMNGLEATRAIRDSENPLGRRIPIIAMTANAFSDDVQHCMEAGMDAHISKPLDIDILENTLRGFFTGEQSKLIR